MKKLLASGLVAATVIGAIFVSVATARKQVASVGAASTGSGSALATHFGPFGPVPPELEDFVRDTGMTQAEADLYTEVLAEFVVREATYRTYTEHSTMTAGEYEVYLLNLLHELDQQIIMALGHARAEELALASLGPLVDILGTDTLTPIPECAPDCVVDPVLGGGGHLSPVSPVGGSFSGSP
jgi:hypothetical protein